MNYKIKKEGKEGEESEEYHHQKGMKAEEKLRANTQKEKDQWCQRTNEGSQWAVQAMPRLR